MVVLFRPTNRANARMAQRQGIIPDTLPDVPDKAIELMTFPLAWKRAFDINPDGHIIGVSVRENEIVRRKDRGFVKQSEVKPEESTEYLCYQCIPPSRVTTVTPIPA